MKQDDILKERFKGYKPAPSPEVWERIEAELNQKKKRGLIIWWFTGLAAVLTGVIFLCLPRQTEHSIFSSNRNAFLLNEKKKTTAANSVSDSQEGSNSGSMNSELTKSNVQNNYQEKSQSQKDLNNNSELNKHLTFSKVRPFIQEEDKILNGEKLKVPYTSDLIRDELILTSMNPLRAKQIEGHGNFEKLQIQPIISLPPNTRTSKFQIQLDYGIYLTGLDSNNQVQPSVSNGLQENNYSGLFNNALTEGPIGVEPYRNVLTGLRLGLHYHWSDKWNVRMNLAQFRYFIFVQDTKLFSQGGSFSQVAAQLDRAVFEAGHLKGYCGLGMSFGRNNLNFAGYSSWRSEITSSFRLSYQLKGSWSLVAEPTARIVVWDSQIANFGRLSKIYGGLQFGLDYEF